MLIKINLFGERKKKGAKTLLWLSAYGLSFAILCIIFLVIYQGTSAELAEKESQIALLEAQLNKLKVVTKEVRDLADKKNSLAEKIAVMAALKKKKAGPVRVMDDLNISVPEKAWVTDIKEMEGGLLKVSGFALDNQTIAGFMKSLDASDYFSNVDLVETKQATIKGIGVKEFILQSSINYLGKLIADQSPIVLPESADAAQSAQAGPADAAKQSGNSEDLTVP